MSTRLFFAFGRKFLRSLFCWLVFRLCSQQLPVMPTRLPLSSAGTIWCCRRLGRGLQSRNLFDWKCNVLRGMPRGYLFLCYWSIILSFLPCRILLPTWGNCAGSLRFWIFFTRQCIILLFLPRRDLFGRGRCFEMRALSGRLHVPRKHNHTDAMPTWNILDNQIVQLYQLQKRIILTIRLFCML